MKVTVALLLITALTAAALLAVLQRSDSTPATAGVAVQVSSTATPTLIPIWMMSADSWSLSGNCFHHSSPSALEACLASAKDVTPEPTKDPTIYTAEDALSRSLYTELPKDVVPIETAVRLVTCDRYHAFVGGGDSEPCGPVWLVGILTEGLTSHVLYPEDIAFAELLPGLTPNPSRPLKGVLYGWDANGRYLTFQGTLTAVGEDTMERLRALDSEELLITPATEVPSVPPFDDQP